MKPIIASALAALLMPAAAHASESAMSAMLEKGGSAFEKANVGTYPATRSEFTKCGGYWHQWSETVATYSAERVAQLPEGLKPAAAKARMAAMQKVASKYVNGSDPAHVKAFNAEIRNHWQNAGFGLATALIGGEAGPVFSVLGSCGEPK